MYKKMNSISAWSAIAVVYSILLMELWGICIFFFTDLFYKSLLRLTKENKEKTETKSEMKQEKLHWTPKKYKGM